MNYRSHLPSGRAGRPGKPSRPVAPAAIGRRDERGGEARLRQGAQEQGAVGRSPAVKARRNKFGAVRTVVDGIEFDSKAEARRYGDLRRMQSLGMISGLTLQPRFPCRVEGVDVCTYIADFAYFRDNARVIEDVKSKATRTPVYRLKKKLVEALYRVTITEVGR